MKHPLLALTTLATIAYFGVWAGATLVLVAAPAIKLLAPESADWKFGLPVQAEIRDADAAVETRWGGARLEVEDVRGSLRLPISAMPWSLFVLLWTYTALAFALLLLFLRASHARRDIPPGGRARARAVAGRVAMAIALCSKVLYDTMVERDYAQP